MDISKDNLQTKKELNDVTGSIEDQLDYKIVSVKIDKYEIKVKLSPNNEFIEIVELKIDKDFINDEKKRASTGYHDVEKYYK